MIDISKDKAISDIVIKIKENNDIVINDALKFKLGRMLYEYDAEYLFKEYGISVESGYSHNQIRYAEKLGYIGYDKLKQYFQ